MLTLGVDLAAKDERTATATIEWLSGRAVLRELAVGVSDRQIVEACEQVDKVGLDGPLGWPSRSSRSSPPTSTVTSR